MKHSRGWPHWMRRDRFTITSASSGSASHPPIADQATPKSELRKLPTSAGALPWVRSDFPRPVGRPPRSLLCNACYLRSEEHTSELQSLAYLVCRLLLEKK